MYSKEAQSGCTAVMKALARRQMVIRNQQQAQQPEIFRRGRGGGQTATFLRDNPQPHVHTRELYKLLECRS